MVELWFGVLAVCITAYVVLAAEATRGAHLLLAPRDQAEAVRSYLDEHGASIIDDTPGDRLNWRGAAIATGAVLLFVVLVAIATLLKG